MMTTAVKSRGSAVELCAGMGGIGLGLRELGFEVVRAYDSWPEAVAIYNHNDGHETAEVCNLLSDRAREVIRAAKRSIGEVELVAAGPPCKGFSQLRNGFHDGRNGHNRVIATMPAYLAILRPRIFLIENVPDLARHREGRTLKSLLEQLARPANGLRYAVDWGVFDAAQFGTPQARRRLFILGVRGASASGLLPEPGPDLAPLYAAVRHQTEVPSHLERYLQRLRDPEDRALTTAKQALSDLAVLDAGELRDRIPYASPPRSAFQRWVRKGAARLVSDARTPAITPATKQRLSHIPPGGCARVIPAHLLNGLSRRYDSAYRRLHPSAPSTALSTKYDCVYHFAKARSLSVREYARLQGIPDRVSFPQELACRRSAYEMIGNSVPPPLVEGVLGGVLEKLDGELG